MNRKPFFDIFFYLARRYSILQHLDSGTAGKLACKASLHVIGRLLFPADNLFIADIFVLEKIVNRVSITAMIAIQVLDYLPGLIAAALEVCYMLPCRF